MYVYIYIYIYMYLSLSLYIYIYIYIYISARDARTRQGSVPLEHRRYRLAGAVFVSLGGSLGRGRMAGPYRVMAGGFRGSLPTLGNYRGS